jgi:hypothetical protein
MLKYEFDGEGYMGNSDNLSLGGGLRICDENEEKK